MKLILRHFRSARPRKTKMARFSAFISKEASDPTSLPRRLLSTSVNLSTIIRHGARSPLWALGCTESLKIGACVGSVVKGAHDDRIVRVEPIVLRVS